MGILKDVGIALLDLGAALRGETRKGGEGKIVLCTHCKGEGGWWIMVDNPKRVADSSKWSQCRTCGGKGKLIAP